VKKGIISFIYTLLAVVIFSACKKDGAETAHDGGTVIVYRDGEVPDNVRINQLQYLGSHNSYRKHTDPKIYKFLQSISGLIPYNIVEWEYDHVTLYEQFERYGVRQAEIDVYGDKHGGLFYNRMGYTLTGRSAESKIEALKTPGLKVLHIPDLDFETHYYTFVQALQDIRKWSDQYPDHLPIYILLEAKTETVGDVLGFLGFVKAEPWDEENIAQIEQEILQVFPREKIIKPDDIRGDFPTLREAVLTKGWPTVGEARGKIMFMLDGQEFSRAYRGGNTSLEGKLLFTNPESADAPDAAFVKVNDPKDAGIPALVRKGFLVRSMVGGVYEAKSGDYSLWEAGVSSGVHFLSTDYYKPDVRAGQPGWTDFTLKVTHHSYQFNPLTY